jgi:hypothetical protein
LSVSFKKLKSTGLSQLDTKTGQFFLLLDFYRLPLALVKIISRNNH